MQDGQNLFDESTAIEQEWQVDETSNSMLAETIIVGMDNSEHRMNEYNFNHHEGYGPGEGKQYIEFIVHTRANVVLIGTDIMNTTLGMLQQKSKQMISSYGSSML